MPHRRLTQRIFTWFYRGSELESLDADSGGGQAGFDESAACKVLARRCRKTAMCQRKRRRQKLARLSGNLYNKERAAPRRHHHDSRQDLAAPHN